MKGIQSFLGHESFYRRFIKDFSIISKPLSSLLMHGVPFFFDEKCMTSFTTLKYKLTSTPIVIALDWELPFKLMCDTSDYAVGTIYSANKTLNDAQLNYATTKKELLAIVFAFDWQQSHCFLKSLNNKISHGKEGHQA